MNRNLAESMGIKGFVRTSMVDWPGRITSVVFLGGCGFRCPACHNHRLVLEPASIPDYPLEEILDYLDKWRSWIDGVTVSGGEPTLRKDLPRLLGLFRDRGLQIKIDTNGSNPSMLEDLLDRDLVDAVSMDVKAPLTTVEYSRVAGVHVDTDVIRRSIGLLRSSDVEVGFRTTVIPGLVEERQLAQIRKSLGSDSHFIVQPFRNLDTLASEMQDVEEFSLGRVERMRSRFGTPSPDFAYV